MKKNTKTYLLIALVALIWGIIGYKIITSGSSELVSPKSSALNDFRPVTPVKKDSFTIVADYRDPFLGTLAKKPKKKTGRSTKPKPQPIPEIPIFYTGSVTESDSQEKIFFVTINGQQYLMGLKDEISNVKLLSGSQSSIKIRHNNKNRTIALQE